MPKFGISFRHILNAKVKPIFSEMLSNFDLAILHNGRLDRSQHVVLRIFLCDINVLARYMYVLQAQIASVLRIYPAHAHIKIHFAHQKQIQ